jgi:hypothetical protein
VTRADFDQRHRFNLIGTITPGHYFKLGVAAAPLLRCTVLDNNRLRQQP